MNVWKSLFWVCCVWACVGSANAETILAEDYFVYEEQISKRSDDFAPIWMRYTDATKRYVLAFNRQVKTTGARELWALVADPANPGKEFPAKIAGAGGGASMTQFMGGGGKRRFFAGYLSWAPEGLGRLMFIENNIVKIGQFDVRTGVVKSTDWIDVGVNNFRTDWSVRNHAVFVSELSGQGDLYMSSIPDGLPMKLGRSDLTQITANEFLDTEPAWSPDGKKLVYTAEPNNNKDVYIIDDIDAILAGNPIELGRKLVSLPSVEANPSWSADGKRIAFYVLQEVEEASDDLFSEAKVKKLSDTASLYVVNADGSGLKELATNVLRSAERGPAWFTQAGWESKIAYIVLASEGTELYVVDADTGEKQRIKVQTRVMSDVAAMPQGEYPFIALSAHDSEGSKRIYIKFLHKVR